MKIGIYGGSFNPIHIGHLKIILNAITKLELDKLIVVPVGVPSHKNKLGDDDKRFHMCELAINSDEMLEIAEAMGLKNQKNLINKIKISRIEIEKKGTSYTYDTLMILKKEYPYSEFYEIIGEDSAYNIMTWKDYNSILEESKVVVFRRESEKTEVTPQIEELLKKMIILDTPYYPFSSSEVRERIKKEDKISGLVPKNVENYIYENKLYK